MYSNCIFCHSDLGSNESIESFPVGRRLAFDAARGRLWVVCRRCERWNLTPLEERWEAIEECDRLYRDTRTRVSTDQIGLARMRDGLELVRIGQPQRPEMAAWRYGDQFGRRRNRHLLYAGAGMAAATSLVVLGPVMGVVAGSTWGIWNLFTMGNTAYQQRRVRARLTLPGATEIAAIRLKELNRVAVIAQGDGWALRVPYQETLRGKRQTRAQGVSLPLLDAKVERVALLTGDDAIQAAGKLLPAINASGAKRTEVQTAVSIIEDVGSAKAVFDRFATRRTRDASKPLEAGTEHVLTLLPKEIKLALEMASHEDAERRALEGELSVLEAAWKEAEEIAAIADDLFLPEETERRFSSLKRGR